MLSKMFYDGADYDEVLKEAQDNGYAERNPEADVEGYDACRKIAILSSLISGQQVDFEDIYTEGITKITKEDMLYAKEMGMTIKLLASSKRHGSHLHAIVAPALLSKGHPLYSVDDVFNAVFRPRQCAGRRDVLRKRCGQAAYSQRRRCGCCGCGKASPQKYHDHVEE